MGWYITDNIFGGSSNFMGKKVKFHQAISVGRFLVRWSHPLGMGPPSLGLACLVLQIAILLSCIGSDRRPWRSCSKFWYCSTKRSYVGKLSFGHALFFWLFQVHLDWRAASSSWSACQNSQLASMGPQPQWVLLLPSQRSGWKESLLLKLLASSCMSKVHGKAHQPKIFWLCPTLSSVLVGWYGW